MKTRSNSLKRFLSWALCICMVLALLPVFSVSVEAAAATTVYMKPSSDWNQANAWFAAYFFNNDTGKNYWVKMTDSNGDGIYEATVPSGTWPNVLFARMNSGVSSMNWNSGTVWNQTADLKLPTNSKTLFTVSGWSGGSWGNPSCSYAGHYMTNDKCERCAKTICQTDGHAFGADNKCTRCPTEGQVIYFQNNWMWSDVQLYYWNDKKDDNGWPGEPMTKFEGDSATSYDYYYMVIPVDCTGFIINGISDNGEGRVQSVDIPISSYYDGVTYCMFYDKTLTGNMNSYLIFPICLDFPTEHKPGDNNTCSRCKTSFCEIDGHNFDMNGDFKCVNCGLLRCHEKGHEFNAVDICEICGTELIWVFFDDNWGWTDVHLYYWYDWDGNELAPEGKPGVQMKIWKQQTGGSNPYKYYKVQIPADVDHFIINGMNNGTEDKTPHLDGDILYNGITFRMLWVDGVGNQVEEPYDMDNKYACAADHAYGETQYVWADDYSSCTATRTCADCGQSQSIEDDGVASWLESVGTCVAPEKEGHEVHFNLIPWAEYQKAISEYEMDPNNHAYDRHYVINEDGTHMFICNACSVPVTEKEAHNKDIVLNPGNCITKAWYRCSVCKLDYQGDINPEVHAVPNTYIIDNGDGTHAAQHPCCSTFVSEAEPHTDAEPNGRCDGCNILMAPAQLRNASVSLKGNIGVNYYMLLSEEVAADETAYMQFTLKDGEVRKVYVSEDLRKEIDGEIYYVFSCDMSAKEMSDEIICQFFYGDNCTDAYPYSIQTYANNILAKFDDADTRNLIIAMLNYGAAAQLHFGYNTENLANSILDEAPDYSNVTVDGFSVTVGQGTANATFYSASLILKSETTVRFFFKGKIVSASYNGQALAVSTRNGLYYVDVVGISAKNLDEEVVITINDGTNTADVHFNPMSYCQSVQNDNSGSFTAEMKDLVCALYLYNYAANVYFKEV